MEYNFLGRTGLKVSRLCYGSLTIGPLQCNLPLDEGIYLLELAVDRGINFIDTADLYGTYPYINPVLKHHKDIVISTRSYAYDKSTAKTTLERALRELGRDYIDIFSLHEQEGPHTIKGHREALDYFIKMKKAGYIRAVGISTHYIAAVKTAALMEEIDVIHPILNINGVGIVDGSLEEMEKVIKMAFECGKGLYNMKPLGGGHLISSYTEAMQYSMNFPYIHSTAVGMQREEEITANIDFFETGQLSDQLLQSLKGYRRKLIIQDWCEGCGKCVECCPQGALAIDESNKAAVDYKKCILCGYCRSACKELAIKVL